MTSGLLKQAVTITPKSYPHSPTITSYLCVNGSLQENNVREQLISSTPCFDPPASLQIQALQETHCLGFQSMLGMQILHTLAGSLPSVVRCTPECYRMPRCLQPPCLCDKEYSGCASSHLAKFESWLPHILNTYPTAAETKFSLSSRHTTQPECSQFPRGLFMQPCNKAVISRGKECCPSRLTPKRPCPLLLGLENAEQGD